MPETIYFEYKGERYTVRQLADIGNMSKATLQSRIYGGWDIDEAVETPVRNRSPRKYNYGGKLYTVAELAKMHGGITVNGMKSRIKSGMSPEQAVTEPVSTGRRIIRKEVQETKEVKKQGWVPHRSPEDLKKCRKCTYSFRDSCGPACGYADDEHAMRRCAPGANCVKYVPRTKKDAKKKHSLWMQGGGK